MCARVCVCVSVCVCVCVRVFMCVSPFKARDYFRTVGLFNNSVYCFELSGTGEERGGREGGRTQPQEPNSISSGNEDNQRES